MMFNYFVNIKNKRSRIVKQYQKAVLCVRAYLRVTAHLFLRGVENGDVESVIAKIYEEFNITREKQTKQPIT